MSKNFLKTAVISAAVCATIVTSALAANDGGGIVQASALNLRASASTDSAIITTAPRGSGVVIRETPTAGWYKVWYKGTEGYMASEFVRTLSDLEGNVGTGTIKGSSVRMRSAPNFEGSTMGYYNDGTQVSVIGVFNEWYKVRLGETVGFVHSDYLNLYYNSQGPSTSNSGQTVTSTGGQAIVDAGKKYMGVPYVWGGTSTSGFDCSGFVYYVYKECGYSINRTAASIYENGTYVEKSQLQVGDTVHFTSGSGNSIGHVGIYIGNNQFIHASSGSGSVVISDLGSNYYLNHYHGARRII